MNIDEKYLSRCLELAKFGLGNTYPNPLVGAVIVHNQEIIGEGWHQKAGEAHAELNAINSVKDISLLSKSTIYVSLEPCSHFGKTPPCSDLLIKHQLKRVVIGMVDPFDKVAGRGIKKLLQAGFEVKVGVLENECNDLNKRFLSFHLKKRPYIILKWATSADGFLSPFETPNENLEKSPVWISNNESKQLVHQWRSQEQAILVGSNTILADDPSLTTRLWKGKSPIRVIIDKKLSCPSDAKVFDGSAKTIVIHSKKFAPNFTENIIFEAINFSENIASQIIRVLVKHDIQSIIIEGGKQTLETFIHSNYWDEARVFKGEIKFTKGIEAPVLKHKARFTQHILNTNLSTYTND